MFVCKQKNLYRIFDTIPQRQNTMEFWMLMKYNYISINHEKQSGIANNKRNIVTVAIMTNQ